MKLRLKFPFKISRVIRQFILADLALLSAWGLILPIFAIFIIERVAGATIITVGISAAVYWITKAIVQVPVAILLDKTPSEKDDYIVLTSGLVLIGFSALAFILIKEVWQLYLVQVIHAVGFGMYHPGWSGIFSRHLDKNHEALDWSLDNATMSIAAGVTGLISGFLVIWFGFSTVFAIAAILSFVSAAVIFSVPKVVFPHRIHKKRVALRDHKPLTNSDK